MSEVTFTLSLWHIFSFGTAIFGGGNTRLEMYLSEEHIQNLQTSLDARDSRLGKRIADMQISTDKKIAERLEPVDVIGTGRASEILINPVQPEEEYRGS